MNDVLRRAGYLPFQATSPRDTHLAVALDAFITEHGGTEGIDAALPDLLGNNEDLGPDSGIPSVNRGVLFFSDGALLGRMEFNPNGGVGEWVLMSEPPPEGKELWERQLVYWNSNLLLKSDQYSLLKQQIAESGDLADVQSLRLAADAVKISKSAVRTLQRKIFDHPEEVAKREMAQRSVEGRERAQRAELERRRRVTEAVGEVSIDDGEAELPLVESRTRRAENEAQRRHEMQKMFAQ